jgi:UDP-N-acetylglucosamine/UDP-N-acetylgalactosamine diphosphorylase
VVLVAGGQGTRLGFNKPKGMYPIGPISNASLFEILFAKTQAVSRRYGKAIPLLLMTSPATHAATVNYLGAHGEFGFAAGDLSVFCQGTMPALDMATGRVLLADKGHLQLSPDGHGGTLRALDRSGLLDALGQRGTRQLFYMQVDNPLVSVCDPTFIGLHLLEGAEVSTQAIAKQSPSDRVGNIVSVDGQVQIIEYSDLPDDVAEVREPDGSLRFWAGNTAVHVFDVDFLARAAHQANALPYHLARKRVPYLDPSGREVDPDQPNAIKFERFIFDLLPAARRAIVVEIDAQREFAPVKNARGEASDSPETVQARMIALHREWLTAAGASVAEGIAVEISPSFALDAAEVAAKIEHGCRVTEPHYFC